MVKNYEQFNESFGSNFIGKIREFGNEIKDIAYECHIENKKYYSKEYQHFNSIKDLFKLTIDKNTYKRLKEFYLKYKERLLNVYNKIFGNNVNEEFSFKKSMFFIILLLALASCYKVTIKESEVYLKVKNTEYIPEKTEWTYHYGYSIMKGKFCFHYGPEYFPEKYEVTLSNGSIVNNQELYKKAVVGDSIKFKKTDYFHDGKYHHTGYNLPNSNSSQPDMFDMSLNLDI